MKILILCTGNSCRSQMAQGFLQSFNKNLVIRSAGTFPASEVNARAINVMHEAGIDISHNTPVNVSEYIHDSWDYVITVCDDANEACPYFTGRVNHRVHFSFKDPSNFRGTEMQIMNEFRRIRDEIQSVFYKFYNDFLINN